MITEGHYAVTVDLRGEYPVVKWGSKATGIPSGERTLRTVGDFTEFAGDLVHGPKPRLDMFGEAA